MSEPKIFVDENGIPVASINEAQMKVIPLEATPAPVSVAIPSTEDEEGDMAYYEAMGRYAANE